MSNREPDASFGAHVVAQVALIIIVILFILEVTK